jgi:hypothetical protein
MMSAGKRASFTQSPKHKKQTSLNWDLYQLESCNVKLKTLIDRHVRNSDVNIDTMLALDRLVETIKAEIETARDE